MQLVNGSSSSDQGGFVPQRGQNETGGNLRDHERAEKGSRSCPTRSVLIITPLQFVPHSASSVIDSRRRTKTTQDQSADTQGSTDAAGASLFEEKPRAGKEKQSKPKSAKYTISQLRALEAKKEQEAVLSYGRVKALWGKMLAGDEAAEKEWMHEAESLVESFRETRPLFLTSRVSVSSK